MATTGELRAIIEELQLIDVGDAASYLGEEALVAEEFLVSGLQQDALSVPRAEFYGDYSVLSCEDSSFR